MTDGEDESTFRRLVSEIEPRLRSAFIAMYGPDRGREATAAALRWAHDHEDAVSRSPDPLRRLYVAGQRLSPTLRSTSLFDRSAQASFMEPQLAKSLAMLPKRHRIATLLIDGAGWSGDEVGDLLKISPSKAKELADWTLPRLARTIIATGDDGQKTTNRSEAEAALRQRLSTMIESVVPPVTADEVLEAGSGLTVTGSSSGAVDTGGTSESRLLRRLGLRWKTLAVAGTVIVVGLGGLAVGIAESRNSTLQAYSTPGLDPLPGKLTSSVLVVANPKASSNPGTNSTVSEMNAGTGQELPAPGTPAGTTATDPVIVGPWIVEIYVPDDVPYAMAGSAVVFHSGSEKTTSLGFATSAFPGLKPGTVWLYQHRGGAVAPNSSACSVRLVSVTGALLTPPAPITCVWRVLGAVTGGLLVLNRSGITEVWDPVHNLTDPLPGFFQPLVQSEGSTLVAEQWATFCSNDCRLRLANPVSGVEKKIHVQPPPGMSLSSYVALSPDGQFLATTAIPVGIAAEIEQQPIIGAGCCFSGDRQLRGQVVIIRLSSGQVALSRPASFLLPSVVQWSPDGSYVFVARSRSRVLAVPAWSLITREQEIPFRTGGGRPPNPGVRFAIASA